MLITIIKAYIRYRRAQRWAKIRDYADLMARWNEIRLADETNAIRMLEG